MMLNLVVKVEHGGSCIPASESPSMPARETITRVGPSSRVETAGTVMLKNKQTHKCLSIPARESMIRV